MMTQTYFVSLMVVLGLCLILFLGLMIQKKREEAKRLREMEFLSAQRRVEGAREKLNNLRKLLYGVENQLTSNKHFYNTKREELIQLAKQMKDIEHETSEIAKEIEEGVSTDQEKNLLDKRKKLVQEKRDELVVKADEKQEEVDVLGKSSTENEAEINKLQNQIELAEGELELSREALKMKERIMKD